VIDSPASEDHRIVVVDDEVRLADLVAVALTDLGYHASAHARAAEVLAVLDQERVDVVLSDLRMPDMDGRALLAEVKRRSPDTAVIIMTAFAAVRDAVDLVKEGAFDFVPKPFEMDEVAATVARALKLSEVVRDNRRLRHELEGRYSFEQLVGSSPSFRRVIEAVAEVCESRATVLLTGESGTGKELVARAIHFNSPRRTKPFVAVNCAAIPEGLLESELFGHVKGAFTGAVSQREGRFRVAEGGTLFLDEIGDMPISIQAKILRVLQERTFEPVGSTRSEKTDVRIIAATHRDLREATLNGGFREDLFYRLNVFPITLPALRDRPEDIPQLAARFLDHFNEEMGKRIVAFTPGALKAMAAYHWPGNIRELQNCVERAVIVCRSSAIDVADLPPYLFETEGRPAPRGLPEDLDAELERIEKAYIVEALRLNGGVQVRAAEMLGIAERSLWHRMKKYNIGKARPEPGDQSNR
jgi:two-component system response regulator AtoC